MTNPAGIVWFRRDLRINDNPALLEAAGRGDIVPLFVLDDRLRKPSGPNRLAFLYGSLRALDASLGRQLVVRKGRPADVISRLAKESGTTTVFCAADFGPYGRRRDEDVERTLSADGVELCRVGSPYAVDPGTVLTKTGSPYRVYSPFYRAWKPVAAEATPVQAPSSITVVDHIRSEGIPKDPSGTSNDLPPTGEGAALDRLQRALERVDSYGDDRNFPALDATTRLSPYLKYGCIHPRQVLAELGTSKSAEVLRKELAWREFYADVLFHQPGSHSEALQEHMAEMRVDSGKRADERFEAWTEGRTGYPIVDAGMRQLRAEGWVHNRVRMIVASFLVKDLHIDWWRGARYFLEHLVDGDLASNNHGWQWVAGTGTDAAPYFRVFNPVLQGEKFDPDGEYVRRYVPELRDLDRAVIHRPWDAPSDLFGGGNGEDGRYPKPIVDHATERDEALARYAEVKR